VKRNEALDHIHQVDKKIEDEPVKDHRVKERNQWTHFQHGLLAEDNPQRAYDSPTKIVEARIGLASSDGFVNLVKPISAVVQGSDGKEDEKYLL
jgi:hypothetical protein